MEADITCAIARWANSQGRCWPGHREANPRKIKSKEKRQVALRQTSAGAAARWAKWSRQWLAGSVAGRGPKGKRRVLGGWGQGCLGGSSRGVMKLGNAYSWGPPLARRKHVPGESTTE